MDIYVLNKQLEIIDVLDQAESIIWTDRYNSAGDFEIYIPANDRVIDVLQIDYYVMRRESDMVGIIKNISLTTDAENGNYYTVTGRDLKSILERRIIWTQTQLSGNAERAIRRLVTENIIAPSVDDRKISNFVLGDVAGLTETISQQFTGDNLLEAIQSICESLNYGFKVTLENKQFVFSLYKGVDRSENQNSVPRVTFSPEFDNLVSTDYNWDETNYKNVALVMGEGEGAARRRQTVGSASGLDRYELYVDSRDVSSNDGTVTEEDYQAQLNQQGVEALAETAIVETFDGEVISGMTYIYNQDFFLGDVVTAENEFGIRAAVRVTEVIESEDATGYKIIPTFNNWRLV